MKYIVYIDYKAIGMANSFDSAMRLADAFDENMIAESLLVPSGYSEITLDEALHFCCDNVFQEICIRHLVGLGLTPENALDKLNLLPDTFKKYIKNEIRH